MLAFGGLTTSQATGPAERNSRRRPSRRRASRPGPADRDEKVSAAQAKVEEITRHDPTQYSVLLPLFSALVRSPGRARRKAPGCSSTISTNLPRKRPKPSTSPSTRRCSKKLSFLPEKGRDTEKIQKLLNGITGIYVKSFEFDVPDVYADSDVEAIRKQVSGSGWSRVVGVREKSGADQKFISGKSGIRMEASW